MIVRRDWTSLFFFIAAMLTGLATAIAQANHVFDGRLWIAWGLYGAAAIFALAGLIAFFRRAEQASPLPSIHNENKQEASPQQATAPINISIGNSSLNCATSAPKQKLDEKPQPRCNIKFMGVTRSMMTPTSPFARYAGQIVPYSSATFENLAIAGEELGVPTLKARAIFENSYGHRIADIPDIVWNPNNGKHATLTANTPKHLLLFFFVKGHFYVRVATESQGVLIGRHHPRRPPEFADHQIPSDIRCIELQLLTDTEELTRVRLRFTDNNGYPEFVECETQPRLHEL